MFFIAIHEEIMFFVVVVLCMNNNYYFEIRQCDKYLPFVSAWGYPGLYLPFVSAWGYPGNTMLISVYINVSETVRDNI
jgi:hypothetical protein